MTSFATYPIDQVQPHPSNVRRDATANDELVASVQSAGILEPVILGPDVDGVRYLIAGNRRYDAAVKAGLTSVPAVLRDDLVTEAQQIEAMLVENLHRSDLTVVEEADAYEQLQLFGLDEAAIATATGRSKATVKARLKLVTLPDAARTRLHDGQITLGDAEALLEFEDDHEMFSELEAALGSGNFKWKVQDLRDRRKRAARNAKKIEEFVELGAVQADDGWRRLFAFHDEALRDPAGHTHCECLGYVDYGPRSNSEPFLVCMDPDSHEEQEAAAAGRVGANTADPDADQRKAEWQAEWEAKWLEAEAQRAAAEAAMKVRVAWLRDFFADQCLGRQKPSVLGKAAAAIVPATLTGGYITDFIDYDRLAAGFDLDDAGLSWEGRSEQLEEAADRIQGGKPAAGVTALAAFLAALTDDLLACDGGHDSDGGARRQLHVWDWLESAGYQLSDVDKEIRASAETVLAEYEAEDADEA